MTTIIATVFVLGVLVFIHELGHFLVSKIFKIRVERFSLGYPPRMIGKKIGDTDYCLSWIPFGGYVKISGMVDESLDTEALEKPPQPWEYRSKPWIQRILVIFAGPLMNIIFPFLVFLAGVLIYGIAEPSLESRLGELVPDMPAAEAGLKSGDHIIEAGGQELTLWQEMTEIIRSSPDKKLSLKWMRGDSLLSSDIIPRPETLVVDGEEKIIGQIGVWPEFQMKRVGIIRAVGQSSVMVYDLCEMMLSTIGKLITGRESIKSLAGPVGIAKMAGDHARAGFASLISFMAFLSLNLAILNLLPIPVLDGGHLLLLGIEGVIRRTIPLKVKLVVQQVGMFLLLALMVFVIYNDIIKAVK